MKIALLFIFLISEILARKLIFVQNMFRHGARYPIFVNNDDFTNQPDIANNAGQLTPQGKNMHYMLGKILYKKYWSQLFAGTPAQKTYDKSLIYVKSTNVNRTIQSVQSQLRGWFENLTPLRLQPKNLNYSLPAFQNLQQYLNLSYTENGWNVFNQMSKYQSIPIHTGLGGEELSSSNPYDQGDFLLKFDKLNCPMQVQWQQQNYDSEMAQYITSLPLVNQALSKLQQNFPSVNVTFRNAYRLIDNFVCMQYLGQPTLKIFQDPKYEKAFSILYNNIGYIKQASMYISLFYQPKQYQTTATGLFQAIVDNMKNVVTGTGPKLILYSAHDTTVGMALAALNLTNLDCINDKYLKDAPNEQTCVSDYPRFAANFVIQLYKEDNGSHTFSLVFNNIQRKIPFCDQQLSCSVQEFYSWVDSWKIKDPNLQCGIEDPFQEQLAKEKLERAKLFAVIAVMVLIIIVLGVWIFYAYAQEVKQNQRKQGYMQDFEEKNIQNKEQNSKQHGLGQIVST